MKRHSRFKTLLIDLPNLTDEEAEELHAHVAPCVPCREKYELYTTNLRLLAPIGQSLSVDVRASVLSACTDRAERRSGRRVARRAAVGALAVAALFAIAIPAAASRIGATHADRVMDKDFTFNTSAPYDFTQTAMQPGMASEGQGKGHRRGEVRPDST